MKVKVIITETLQKEVTVEAKSIRQAEQLAFERWKNSEYILDAECFSRVKIEAV